MAVDRILKRWSNRKSSVSPGHLFEMDEGPVSHAGKPDCYVNQSGSVVSQWIDHLDIQPDNCLVIYDDFSIELGTIRLRPSGSAGGHRGLKDVIEKCGTDDIPRLRVGMGPIPSSEDPADFVLSPIADSDRQCIHQVLSAVPDTLQSIEEDGFDAAMSHWNGVEFDAGR
jgi:PTH1 family peptidyl-tRNA hydrolase